MFSIITSGILDNLHSSEGGSTSLHQRYSGASSSSTNARLLTSSPHPPTAGASRSKLFTKPFAPTSCEDVQLGMGVLVTRSRGQIARGVVRYVGLIPGRKDTYIGVELGPGQGKYILS